MTLVCWILVDKYGLAIYNENRVKKRLSTYLDCGGLASVIFPTMKSLDAGKKSADKASEKATAGDNNGFFTPNEKIDFSNVKIEPLFEEQVDFETFSNVCYRIHHGCYTGIYQSESR